MRQIGPKAVMPRRRRQRLREAELAAAGFAPFRRMGAHRKSEAPAMRDRIGDPALRARAKAAVEGGLLSRIGGPVGEIARLHPGRPKHAPGRFGGGWQRRGTRLQRGFCGAGRGRPKGQDKQQMADFRSPARDRAALAPAAGARQRTISVCGDGACQLFAGSRMCHWDTIRLSDCSSLWAGSGMRLGAPSGSWLSVTTRL
jgi:hypothetical protein